MLLPSILVRRLDFKGASCQKYGVVQILKVEQDSLDVFFHVPSWFVTVERRMSMTTSCLATSSALACRLATILPSPLARSSRQV